MWKYLQHQVVGQIENLKEMFGRLLSDDGFDLPDGAGTDGRYKPVQLRSNAEVGKSGTRRRNLGWDISGMSHSLRKSFEADQSGESLGSTSTNQIESTDENASLQNDREGIFERDLVLRRFNTCMEMYGSWTSVVLTS